MNGMGDVLQRFHQVLVEEIKERRPEYLTGPFTVAEIYQNLVPYGTHRDRLGVEMNGDYEDALLRLLAGEGGFVELESEHALKQLREELESSNPNTGLYREFAAVDVRLVGAPARRPAEDLMFGVDGTGQGVEEAVETMSIADLAPVAEEATLYEAPAAAERPIDPVGSAAVSRTPASAGSPDTCPWCRATLPARGNLNFCPFCGTDVHLVPCPGCGEELEPDWRFCISCGTEVGG